jgi:RimJ/RimL family protein N-acetyltransferase
MNELYTERLMLRPLAASDSNDLFAARCDEEVMAYWDGRPTRIPLKQRQ